MADLAGPGGKLGGIEYLAGAIDAVRAQAPDRTVVLDAGDCFQGDYAVNSTEGLFCTEYFNLMNYSARSIGNHEFDYLDVGAGEPVDVRGALKKSVKAAGQPVVLANVHLVGRAPISQEFKEFTVMTVGGVKVGITGILTPMTPTVSRRLGSDGLVFEDPVAALARVVPAMRAAGAGVVVVITHLTGVCPRGDLLYPAGTYSACSVGGELAAIEKSFSNSDIDLIVSGHDHVLLRGDGPAIPVLENLGQGTFVGVAEIDVDLATGKRTGAVRVPEHVPVCVQQTVGSKVCDTSWAGFIGAIKPNQAVTDLRKRAEAAVKDICDDVVVTAPEPILYSRVLEPPLSNLAADLLLELGTVTDSDGNVVPADIAFLNRGATRGSLDAGAVTVCDLARVWPFEDGPVLVLLTGAEIAAMMKFMIDDVVKPLAIAGFKVIRTPSGNLTQVNFSGQILDPERMYRTVTTRYLTDGGSGLDRFFKDLPADRFIQLPDSSYRDGFIRVLRGRKEILNPDVARYTGVIRD
jgi:2',3'-cyclic-nucleotide 2'-phosphodiesterase (5'-nucleotidase family)